MDYSYWDNYYLTKDAPKMPSKFAEDILPYLDQGKTLVELGCGNGRDSLFFANNNLEVLGIDQSHSAISKLQSNYSKKNVQFIAEDFLQSKFMNYSNIDYVYSRFTLHSITEKEEDILLKSVFNSLKVGGKIFIEARSVKDNIFGLGDKVSRNAYVYNDHYRRFLVMEELAEKLEGIGFKIIQMVEGSNYAIYKDENPVVLRLIGEKV